MKLTIEDVVAEFNRPVTLNEHGCWLWLGATDNYGYARYGGTTLVHGYTCRMAGKITGDGEVLRHQCPNHNCINPDHFLVGTQKQNMNDDNRMKMGPDGKLSSEQIVKLRKMLSEGLHTQTEIADYFGVSPQWISKFKRGGFKYAQSQ